MMKIQNSNKAGTVKKSKTEKSSGVTDSAFSQMVGNTSKAEASPAIENVEATKPLPDALSGKSPEQYATAHAEDILDKLEELHMGLITGTVTEKTLRNMTKMIKNYQSTISNPELEAILDDIHLRAEVELAKYILAKI